MSCEGHSRYRNSRNKGLEAQRSLASGETGSVAPKGDGGWGEIPVKGDAEASAGPLARAPLRAQEFLLHLESQYILNFALRCLGETFFVFHIYQNISALSVMFV